MMRALLLGGALVTLGGALVTLGSPAAPCSPVQYDDEQDRLTDALRYYESADWVAVGVATAFQELSPKDVWARHGLDLPEDILAGIGPESEPYLTEESPYGLKYSFKIVEEIKGDAPSAASVWSVDVPRFEHPFAREPDWPKGVAVGTHPNSPDCSVFPAFGMNQAVLLIRPKNVRAEDLGDGNPEIYADRAAEFSRARFRSFEPTSSDDEWYLALKVAAMLDRGGWPSSKLFDLIY